MAGEGRSPRVKPRSGFRAGNCCRWRGLSVDFREPVKRLRNSQGQPEILYLVGSRRIITSSWVQVKFQTRGIDFSRRSRLNSRPKEAGDEFKS
jgi:hypothetical protein